MTMTPDRQKVDRDEVFLEYTKSICPVCKTVIDAEVNARDNKVFLRKRCPEHGQFEALVYGDAEMYATSLRFNKPGTIPLQTPDRGQGRLPARLRPVPGAQAARLPRDHRGQHRPATSTARSASPTRARHQPDGYSLTLDQVEADARRVRAPPRASPRWSMLSGGEPSIHPADPRVHAMAAAKARGIPLVMLNTNGIRLARDPRVRAGARRSSAVHIYLQFDGFDDATHLAIRGRRLQETSRRRWIAAPRPALASRWSRRSSAGSTSTSSARSSGSASSTRPSTLVFFQPVTHSGPPRRVRPAEPADQRRRDPRRCRPAARSGSARTTSSRCRAAPRRAARIPTPLRRRGPRPDAAARPRRRLPRLRHQPRRARPRGRAAR